MKKRKILMLIITILFMVVLVGCKTNNNVIIVDNDRKEDNTTQITFFGYKADDINLVAIENALHSYMRNHNDVSVVYEGAKSSSYWKALDLRYKTNNLDDVLMIDQARLTEMKNDLVDISDVIDVDMFSDLVKSQMVMDDGKVLYIPMNLASYCLYVNYDMLGADGMDVPTNLSEFRNVCNYYVNNKHINPIICNNNNSLRTIVEACGLFDVYQNNDINIKDFNSNPTLLMPYLDDGIKLVDEMIKSGWINPLEVKNTTQTDGDIIKFVKGEKPFMITGGWVSLRIKDMLEKNNKNMNFGVHPYPILDDGSVLLINVTTCISVNSKSKNLAKAKEFVSCIVNPDSIWEYCDSQCSFSPLRDETRIPTEPTVKPTAPYYNNGRVVIGADYRLNVPLDLYLTDCTNKMLDGMNLSSANNYLHELLAGGIL